MKEQIVKRIIFCEDEQILSAVRDFIEEKSHSAAMSGNVSDIDTFYDRLKGQYGDVLRKLSQ